MIIIGIAGPSGSGKSLLARNIFETLSSEELAIIYEDTYYKDQAHLTLQERSQVNYDHPNSMDHELLIKQLRDYKAGKPINMPLYDYSQYTRSQETRLIKANHKILLIEGILLFNDPRLRELMDIRIYVDTDLDLCLIRRLTRDIAERDRTMESVIQQYEATVRPMFMQFIEPSKKYADIVVPHGGKNQIAIDIIMAKMQKILTTTEA